MTTASKVIKLATSQIGVCERPANSNMQKYGKAYGWNGTFWCAQFVWWLGWKASGKNEAQNPIGKSASAAYIQEETVKKGGMWMMKKTTSKATRLAYAKRAKPGDIVSMDFGAMDAVRDHVGIVKEVRGNYLLCVEGNTSKTGSQSNGGMVCDQLRPYYYICSAVRPKYEPEKQIPIPKKKYTGTLPKLPKRGYFTFGDESKQVSLLQKFLNYAVGANLAVDGKYKYNTQDAVWDFEYQQGLTIDGDFGEKCLAKAKAMTKVKEKTIAEKIVAYSKSVEDDGSFSYKKWDSKDKNTQICPICNKQTGKYKGWNCIGFVSACDYHGGGLKDVECSCKGLGDDSFFTNVTLESWRKRNGDDWDMITNGGSKGGASIASSKLKAGDHVICYDGNGKFKHIVLYVGNGKYRDSTGSAKPNIATRDYTALTKKYHCTRAFRPKG